MTSPHLGPARSIQAISRLPRATRSSRNIRHRGAYDLLPRSPAVRNPYRIRTGLSGDGEGGFYPEIAVYRRGRFSQSISVLYIWSNGSASGLHGRLGKPAHAFLATHLTFDPPASAVTATASEAILEPASLYDRCLEAMPMEHCRKRSISGNAPYVESWRWRISGFVFAVLKRWQRNYGELPHSFCMVMCPQVEINALGGLPSRAAALTHPKLSCRHFTGCHKPYFVVIFMGEDADEQRASPSAATVVRGLSGRDQGRRYPTELRRRRGRPGRRSGKRYVTDLARPSCYWGTDQDP
jgi:hypothetical protein